MGSLPRHHDDAAVVRRFADAWRLGDAAALASVLHSDAIAVCDGGGFVVAPALPAYGKSAVIGLLEALPNGGRLTVESVNGHPGLVRRRAGRAVAVVAVSVDDGRITFLWVVLNPLKLSDWL